MIKVFKEIKQWCHVKDCLAFRIIDQDKHEIIDHWYCEDHTENKDE